MLAQRLVVHEEIAQIAVAVDLMNPPRELLRGQRPLLPAPVREPERDVVRQPVVLQQQREGTPPGRPLARVRRPVHKVRRPEPENAIHPLAEHPLEPRAALAVLERGDEVRHIVVVGELGVAEDRRRLPEERLDPPGVLLDLLPELLTRIQERQRMVRGLGQKLAAPRVGQLPEQVQHIGRPRLDLIEHHARHRVGNLEGALVNLHHVADEPRRRTVALVGHLQQNLLVLGVVKVERIGVEDRVAAQAVGLVDLKIEDDGGHAVFSRWNDGAAARRARRER